jgi:nucleotide-binding universal stress UspA family protein
MFETILVPLDGSELAETALAPALELRDKLGSKLILLRAVEPASHHLVQAPGVFESPSAAVANVELIQKMTEAEREEARTYLENVRERVGDKNVEAILVEADPTDAVVDTAQERGAGLIVMSSHGRGGLGKLIFGSVADGVLKRSKAPVLLIRHESS